MTLLVGAWLCRRYSFVTAGASGFFLLTMIAECLFAWGATKQQQQQGLGQGQAQGQALPRALSARCGQPRSPRSYKYSNSFAQIAASGTNRAPAHHLLMHCNTGAARAKGITSRLRPCCVDRGVVIRGGSVVCACRSLQAKQTIAAVNLVLILIDVLLGKQIEKFAGQILE